MKMLSFVNVLLVPFLCFGKGKPIPARISALRFDKSQVSSIYLAPGLGSIVTFPCELQEVFLGRGEDLKAQISPNDKKVLLMNLKLDSSLATNLIAKCENERSVFVFDVIPSKARHQDVVDIRLATGSAPMIGFRPTEFSQVRTRSTHKIVLKAPVLMNSRRVAR